LLRHDQKQVHKEIDSAAVLSNGIGVILSKQGLTIKENEHISVSIDTNEYSSNPRIDLIVLDHNYINIEGGSTAVYMVIKGTPAEIPETPALLNENTQIVIGSLYVQAGASALVAGYSYFDRNVLRNKAYSYELTEGVDYVLGSVIANGLSIILKDGQLKITGIITAITNATVLLTFKKHISDCKFVSLTEISGAYSPEMIIISGNVMSVASGTTGKKVHFNNSIII
jgi:hypothetical protein